MTMFDEGMGTQINGYCIRDMHKFDKNIVFQHKSKEVCDKMLKLLNE